MRDVYPIPPGLYCVPSAIIALTGEDLQSVVLPALNRQQDGPWLQGPVAGVKIHHTEAALKQIGYHVRSYKGSEKLRVPLRVWAKRSEECYAGRKLLVATIDHMVALVNGKVYDSFTPYGEEGSSHPFARDVVHWVALIEKQQLPKP